MRKGRQKNIACPDWIQCGRWPSMCIHSCIYLVRLPSSRCSGKASSSRMKGIMKFEPAGVKLMQEFLQALATCTTPSLTHTRFTGLSDRQEQYIDNCNRQLPIALLKEARAGTADMARGVMASQAAAMIRCEPPPGGCHHQLSERSPSFDQA